MPVLFFYPGTDPSLKNVRHSFDVWHKASRLTKALIKVNMVQKKVQYVIIARASGAPANIIECASVHWLCASDDLTDDVVARRFGRLTGSRHANLWLGDSVADCQVWPHKSMVW